MDDDIPKEDLRIFKDILECSVTYELSKIIFRKLEKRK